MSRSLWILRSSGLSLLVPALTGCHVSGCREGDMVCAALTASETGAGSTDETTVTSNEPTASTDTGTGTEPGTSTETDPTTGEAGVCGDAVVTADEDCDDGNDDETDACLSTCAFARCGDGTIHIGLEQCDDGNDDNADECTNNCQLARCGDGYVHPPEVCDEGKANSNTIYGGCGVTCELGPGCGDGIVNGPEECDDQNDDPADGCLAGCIEATSCKQILEIHPGVPSGSYRVWREAFGNALDVTVYCDMETDGGGYTFLKVDTEYGNASDKGAKVAEKQCNGYDMHLFVPRTEAHLKSAYTLATTDNLTPVGGGKIGKGSEYLSILAIFPTVNGATCEGKGLNSVDCPMWRARDDEAFWVTKTPVAGEPSDEHCIECSMFYKWNADGTLKSYTTFPVGEGASSYRFLCDIADKV